MQTAALPLPARVIHRGKSLGGGLPLLVRKAEYKPVPDVHVVDRRLQRCRSPPGPESRLCHRCRDGSGGPASTCPYKSLGQSAALELRRQHVQVRFRQRRPRGEPGLDGVGFTRESDGAIRHFYTAHPQLANNIKERGLDLMSPIWHILDFTPQGRGDWYAKLDYGTNAHASRR